jgi:hypothetical protein
MGAGVLFALFVFANNMTDTSAALQPHYSLCSATPGALPATALCGGMNEHDEL